MYLDITNRFKFLLLGQDKTWPHKLEPNWKDQALGNTLFQDNLWLVWDHLVQRRKKRERGFKHLTCYGLCLDPAVSTSSKLCPEATEPCGQRFNSVSFISYRDTDREERESCPLCPLLKSLILQDQLSCCLATNLTTHCCQSMKTEKHQRAISTIWWCGWSCLPRFILTATSALLHQSARPMKPSHAAQDSSTTPRPPNLLSACRERAHWPQCLLTSRYTTVYHYIRGIVCAVL